MMHKIGIVGSKGIPASYGGYETFAEEISTQFVQAGYEVVVVGESRTDVEGHVLRGVEVLVSRYIKSKNPLLFYHDSIRKALSVKCTKIIVCGVGGVFSAFLYQKKVDIYVNPDGLGFNRAKWSLVKRKALYVQYLFCAEFIDNIIADSFGIAKYFTSKFARIQGLYVAEYGAKLPKATAGEDEMYLSRYGLLKNNYAICVARIEPENNVELILEGFVRYIEEYDRSFILVVVGNTDTKFARKLVLKYDCFDLIRFVGGVYDKPVLKTLRENASLAFHGHSVGGTNPSLLEAMLSKVPIVAHDNDFNREVLDDRGCFFLNKGDISECIHKVRNSDLQDQVEYLKNRVITYYSWKEIARKYLEILFK